MSDLISRQAAIDAAREELESGTFYDIPSKIEELPSAQPERKKGKWIEEDIHSNWSDWTLYFCSECGKQFKNLEERNFCPNCGAKMEE